MLVPKMRRLAVTLAAFSAAALSAITNAQDGGCTDFMTMQANYMALVILRSIVRLRLRTALRLR